MVMRNGHIGGYNERINIDVFKTILSELDEPEI